MEQWPSAKLRLMNQKDMKERICCCKRFYNIFHLLFTQQITGTSMCRKAESKVDNWLEKQVVETTT